MFTDQIQSNKFRKTKIGNCEWHLVLSDKRNGILRAMKMVAAAARVVESPMASFGNKNELKIRLFGMKKNYRKLIFLPFSIPKNHSRPAFCNTNTHVYKPYGQKKKKSYYNERLEKCSVHFCDFFSLCRNLLLVFAYENIKTVNFLSKHTMAQNTTHNKRWLRLDRLTELCSCTL